MPYQGQGQVRSPKVITNYLFDWVRAAHDLWAILFIECNSETQKVIRASVRSRSVRYQVQAGRNRSQFEVGISESNSCPSASVFYYEFIDSTFVPVGGLQPPNNSVLKIVYAVLVVFGPFGYKKS